ncbi:GH19425 [Drosophila grimshawi]|uniref:GH19425 n=2 Tax=Drosophila grimshawi TaxID=7222 RepID=B4JG74_DROGR|nr:GH19425 [Drosophila grimshawi]
MPVSYQNLSYEELNMKLGRELSPHLTIYKIQLTSAMSILLRISGFVLGMGFWAIGLMGLFCNMDINELATKIEEFELSKNFLSFLKFIIILPFAYHMVVGTRHLIFYLNVFLSKKGIYATGYAALAMTLIVAAALTGINLENEMEDLCEVSNVGQLGAEVQSLVNEKSDE